MSCNKTFISMIIIFLLASTVFWGCSGSSSSPPPWLLPFWLGSFEITPASHDFGTVTVGNSPAPIEVLLFNKSWFGIDVSDMALSDTDIFVLNTSGGTDPCNTKSPTLAPGARCTVTVSFIPDAVASLEGTLTISSNDRDNPVIDIPLTGTGDYISGLNVKINQVETECPEVTSYVSVTDQEGYPLTELIEADFTVEEEGTTITPLNSFAYVSEMTTPISVVLAMDYSGSITETEGAVENMEAGAVEFINLFTENDEAEIIKFDTQIEVVQEFTSDKAALASAIITPWDKGIDTRLYETIYKAIEDTAVKIDSRRAVIIITDGRDDPGNNNPPSNYTRSQVIDYAIEQGVPVFTVGLGDRISPYILNQIADKTGGQFYEAWTPYDIRTIYRQLATLIINQYVLTYDSYLGSGAEGDLSIEAAHQAINGNDTKEITPCPVP